MIITAYRITKAKYAASIWSGSGARDFGGRWNSKGIAVVYAAENRSLAAMEQLAHLRKPRALSGFVIATIVFDSSRVRRVLPSRLPHGWNDPIAPATLRSIGDEWIAHGKSLVLAVPSAVMTGEWNYLLNPLHPEFIRLKKSRPRPFIFDRRIG